LTGVRSSLSYGAAKKANVPGAKRAHQNEKECAPHPTPLPHYPPYRYGRLFCRSIQTEGGPQKINCANTEGIFRIIQSIPSPKAEPFKRWLAKVGYDRVQEIENPELATKRTRALYKAKGYSDDWIEKRMRGIAIREELTDDWKKRNVTEKKEYEILTTEIAKAAFGITPGKHKQIKGLKRENLRDHMTDLELIFSIKKKNSSNGAAFHLVVKETR
jgi:hypothetical protein